MQVAIWDEKHIQIPMILNKFVIASFLLEL